ncbi:hypothetical protein VULLAG_LOCUS18249 [Vulpes lagopus]
MGELAQLPWWQRLKWRRLRWLQQPRARGFGGGARGLGCAVRTPARGPEDASDGGVSEKHLWASGFEREL